MQDLFTELSLHRPMNHIGSEQYIPDFGGRQEHRSIYTVWHFIHTVQNHCRRSQLHGVPLLPQSGDLANQSLIARPTTSPHPDNKVTHHCLGCLSKAETRSFRVPRRPHYHGQLRGREGGTNSPVIRARHLSQKWQVPSTDY